MPAMPWGLARFYPTPVSRRLLTRATIPASRPHGSLAYSAWACMRIGMSGSASFHRVRKSW